MGLTTLRIKIGTAGARSRWTETEMLVDSGAFLAVVPGPLLRRLGIRPHGRETFRLADGSTIQRGVGSAVFELDGRKGAAPVVFGEPGDSTLLGVLALEAMGLMLDPLKRELRPLPMLL